MIALETSIAMFSTDPSFGEESIGLFLLLSQFVNPRTLREEIA
jgi:hypothetical protein